MKAYQLNARIAGILFIVATAAGILSLPFISIIDGDMYLADIAADGTRLITGVLLLMTMAAACTGIAVALNPALRQHNPALAAGSLAFRTMEGALFMVSAVALYALLPLSRAGTAPDAYALGDVVKTLHNFAASGPGAIAFCLGAMQYLWVFYRSRLIPRWLSVWGLVAIVMHLAAVVSVILGRDSFSTVIIILNVPIALQELVLAVWLLVKGFNPEALHAGKTPA